jgi:hypothetical protein
MDFEVERHVADARNPKNPRRFSGKADYFSAGALNIGDRTQASVIPSECAGDSADNPDGQERDARHFALSGWRGAVCRVGACGWEIHRFHR